MTSQILPKELLKFRLDKQLSRLKQLIIISDSNVSEDEIAEEDNFQLYQRVLSWFIMGRLAKSEYDAILETLLNSTERIEVHNKIIELLRAIYCDTNSGSGPAALGNELSERNLFFSNSFEFNLLPPSEREETAATEKEIVNLEEQQEDLITIMDASLIVPKSFNTNVDNLNLTSAEEALISEALRNPIHELASNERDVLIPGINFKFNDLVGGGGLIRKCTEMAALPDQNMMKKRFIRVAMENVPLDSGPIIPDPIAALACKALEDYMRNLLENVASLKFGHQALLRPPISYIFPNLTESNKDGVEGGKVYAERSLKSFEASNVNLKDLKLLFKLKPWLLAEMEADISQSQPE